MKIHINIRLVSTNSRTPNVFIYGQPQLYIIPENYTNGKSIRNYSTYIISIMIFELVMFFS